MHRDLRPLAIQQADHYLFAELCWQRGDSQVDPLSFIAKPASAVLGPPAISNIHSRNDFHSRDGRFLLILAHPDHVVQQSVDSITDLQMRLFRLHMNVTRAALCGAAYNQVHESDDW